MHIGRSTRVGLAKNDMGPAELAKALGVSVITARAICRNKNARSDRIVELAKIFGATTSEFISWGE